MKEGAPCGRSNRRRPARPGPGHTDAPRKLIPPIQFSGPARQHVLEPPERSSPGNGDLQPVGTPRITHRPDELLHVPVAVPGPLAVHPQPLVGVVRFVLILLPDLPRVVDGRRRPDLAGRQVDAPAAYIGSPSRMPTSSSRSTGSGRRSGIAPFPSNASSWSARTSSPSQSRSRSAATIRRAASPAPSACCSSAASTQSPKACRPFSGTAGPVISMTAVPSSAGTLTRSEMRLSSVLFFFRVLSRVTGAWPPRRCPTCPAFLGRGCPR
jgi:hypothetical protein